MTSYTNPNGDVVTAKQLAAEVVSSGDDDVACMIDAFCDDIGADEFEVMFEAVMAEIPNAKFDPVMAAGWDDAIADVEAESRAEARAFGG